MSDQEYKWNIGKKGLAIPLVQDLLGDEKKKIYYFLPPFNNE